MGSWLNLFGKELILIILVLSYVFGNQYNKKYTTLMNSLGDTLYNFPNVRERQTRNANLSNELLTKRIANCKRSVYDAPNANSQGCCRPPCIINIKSSVNRASIDTIRRLTNTRNRARTSIDLIHYNEINDINKVRYFRSIPTYDYVLNRKVKSETDDILNSIGGDLKRIETKIIQSSNKINNHQQEQSMSTDELIKNLKSMKMGDTKLAESILLKENKPKEEEKSKKMSNTNILENAFHHLSNKNHVVLHPKLEPVELKAIQNEPKNDIEDEGERPALLSFFKDEGEPIINQTEDEHGDFTEDPFQGTVIRPMASKENRIIRGNFEEYESPSIEKKKKKKVISVSAQSRSHITRSLNASVENVSNSTNSISDDDIALDPQTGNRISIKSIFANAVEEAIESAEGKVAKNVVGHKENATQENGNSDSSVRNLDPIDKFLNDSKNYIPENVTSVEFNMTNLNKPKDFVQDKIVNIDEIIAKSLTNTIANSQQNNVDKDSDSLTKNINNDNGSNTNNNSKKDAEKDSNNNNISSKGMAGIPTSILKYYMANETKTPKYKEPNVSPIGEDYIESDVLPMHGDLSKINGPLGEEYVDSMLPIDVSLQPQKSLLDDETAHSILKEKDIIRSNYVHEHKDLNKEILELIQSYYKTGGRKHLKDIYRDSKWNRANRNRIEFFNAVDKENIGAVCMDGSRPGYYLRKGFDSGADKWIIHLHGGAWCYNLQTCYKRRNTILGSTKGYSREDISKFFHGILSKNADENPYFYKWNIAVLSYCDGGLFSGNRKMFLMGKGKKFYFRGRRVLRLLMENLRRQQNLQKAKEVILSGTSAGGLALILQGDYIRKFLPKNIKVRGLADAAFFLDQKRNGAHSNRMAHKQFKALYELHRPVLKKKCVDSYPKKDRYLCLFPQNTIHFVKLPLFIVNSLYDHWQLSYLEGINCIYDNSECKTQQRDHILNFRNRMYSTLNDVKTFKNNTGIFANSCIAHGQVILDYTWARSKIDNTSIAEAFVNWYKSSEDADTEGMNFHADCKYPCNGSCPRTLAQTCVENFKAVTSSQRDKSLNLC